MNISEYCKATGLHAPTVQSYIAGLRQISRVNVDMKEELAPGQQKLLSDQFPDHKKIITITCDEDENVTIRYIGGWNGRIYRAAARKFEGSYKKAMRNLQHVDRPEGFVSYPKREEIQEERAQRAEAHKKALMAKGRLRPDGSLQTDTQLAETLDKTSLPSPIGQAPTKVKSLVPQAEKSIPKEPEGPEPATRVLVNTQVELETDLPDKALPNQDPEKVEKPKAEAKQVKVKKKPTTTKGSK